MSKSDLPEVVIDISEEEYRAELDTGLTADEVLTPGRHRFRRGGFLARHNLTPSQTPPTGQKPVTLLLDEDVLAFFQERAQGADTHSYQAEINAALRDVMLRERS